MEVLCSVYLFGKLKQRQRVPIFFIKIGAKLLVTKKFYGIFVFSFETEGGGFMSRLLKVILEFDDKIMTIEGDEALKWDSHNISLAVLANSHSINPFDHDPVRWTVQTKNIPTF
jgi:hypothetical protein